jgi:hypothetical protein
VLTYEPTARGLLQAREAIAEWHAGQGVSARADQMILTGSTSEAYGWLFKLLCNPGDNVLTPRPSYPLFECLAELECVEARQYSLLEEIRWGIDIASIEAAVTERTRAIVVVNPNNPTGSFVKRGELDRLMRLCQERGVALISDEVFSDYAFAPDADRVGSVADVSGCLAFCMSGLSKVAAFPQMKLGWIVAGGPEELRREAFEKLEWIADTYLSVSTPVQCAAARFLEAGETVQGQIRRRCAANLEFLRGTLAGTPAGVLTVEGGWCATVQAPRTRSEEEWTLALLQEHNVLVQPGYFYDFESEAFLVVSLLTEPARFREGVTRLRVKIKET